MINNAREVMLRGLFKRFLISIVSGTLVQMFLQGVVSDEMPVSWLFMLNASYSLMDALSSPALKAKSKHRAVSFGKPLDSSPIGLQSPSRRQHTSFCRLSSGSSPLGSPRRFSSPTGSRGEALYSDRFIPSRLTSKLEGALSVCAEGPAQANDEPRRHSTGSPRTHTNGSNGSPHVARENQGLMNNLLRAELLGHPLASPKTEKTDDSVHTHALAHTQNMLHFQSPKRTYGQWDDTINVLSPASPSILPMSPARDTDFMAPRKVKRKIPKVPFKVLDAPSLQDDFYLNLVDWSSNNVLAVGLGPCVYLWSACTSRVTKLCDVGPEDLVTSVSWTQRGSHIAVGTNLGRVRIWDASRCKHVRDAQSHTARVGTLAWNGSTVASGSRDRKIMLQDVRSRGSRAGTEAEDPSAQCLIRTLEAHKQEVCGLRWSFSETQLASGGNDNKLYVWNMHSSTPVNRFADHTAAVKALAWSPHVGGLLASGGGTADRHIRFWNTLTGTSLHKIDTGSQVCNLMWSRNVNEIVSTHGYSLNQIILWRVLYLAMSPDGQTIVTGAGDETLRFWNVFPSPKNRIGSRIGSSLLVPTGGELR